MGRKKDKNRRKFQSQKNSAPLKQDLLKNSNETVNLLNESNTPIDIISRLDLPFIEPSANDAISKNDEEEEDFEFNFRPRVVYACNLCLVCMENCDGSASCENCGLVSYCSNKHKEENFAEHRNLCKILKNVCNLSLAKELDPDQYRTFRVKLIEIIEHSLNRNLNLWEREIILYPPLCRTCHGKKDLTFCPKCQMEFFCSKDHHGDHDQYCNEFQVFKRILFLQKNFGSVVPKLPNKIYKEPHLLPENLDHLLADLFGFSSEYYKKMDCHSYASLSYMATVPLTTLYAMQKSCENWKTRKSISIHIIGAEFQFECFNLQIWEKIFLHYLPNLIDLTLIFIGPELQVPEILVKILQKVKICSYCRTTGRKINVIFNQGKLYHEIKESKVMSNPDIVCLFNPGLYRKTGFNGNDTWPLTIRKFCQLKSPVVITAYTQKEIPQDIQAIKSVCEINEILEPQKNPFAALKPDRNFVSDDIAPLMYKNHFISIIKGV